MLEPHTIKKVSQEIYRRFPQVAGIKPNVKKQTTNNKAGETYLLIYTNQGTKSPDAPITTYVRVVVNETGQILKLSTSR
jgi:hypothetical protein